MSKNFRQICLLLTILLVATAISTAAQAAKGKTLKIVKSKDWNELYVRRVLNTFAFGGLATDAQIETWGSMSPKQAVSEILTFNSINEKLSPPEAGDDNSLHCGTLAELQAFWSGDDAGNIMKYSDRYRYGVLNSRSKLSTSNLQATWTKAISTRGCNPFLHKMALYITNYHASISAHKTRAGLIRDYYDNIMLGLQNGDNFIELMTIAGKDAALSKAYGHEYSIYNNWRGMFFGTDDFAREYHQPLQRRFGCEQLSGNLSSTDLWCQCR